MTDWKYQRYWFMSKLIAHFFSLLSAGLAGMGIRSSEEANFRLLSEEGQIQIRLYSPMLIAKTEIETDYNQAGKIGFNRLSGYLFGRNVQQLEMSMTTPVFREFIWNTENLDEASPNFTKTIKWIMSFVMPSSFDLTTLPEPSDPFVIIEAIPAKKTATLRYSGSQNQERITEYSEILIAWLDEQNFKRLSNPRSASYDPPWTLTNLRRNEIHIDIE